MSTFESVKFELVEISKEFSALFTKARETPGISKFPFEDWETVCHALREQIDEDILRVAVVGAIKSGKSTFVNSFLEGDYLKRGAGVVTSIVTKVRKGTTLEATLVFKTWEEINSDIRQAIVLFPALEWEAGEREFDIRKSKDRGELAAALASLSVEQVIRQDTRDMNVVLLASYLKGYDRVKDIISWDTATQTFHEEEFGRHRDFVGDDALAVYLKDLKLQIPQRRNLDDNIEIADCQGSDSPNPLHLAMIQDYLLKTHLIVYLLSSRTGIRQADVKFLSMIKKMGLLDNIFFVVNCDFNEHEDLADLKHLIEKTREDISVIKSDPVMFTFSTLFDLFGKLGDDVSEKNKGRRIQWERETELVAFSEGERNGFEKAFYEKLSRDRFNLLVRSHLERFSVIASGLSEWVGITTDILSKDASEARSLVEKIRYEQDQIGQVRSVVKDTIDGASQKTKRDLEKDINSFLDARFGDLIQDIRAFVRGYAFDAGQSEGDLDGMGFSATLYMVFQDFKQALDRYMTETVNPRLIQFIRQDEKKIDTFLATVGAPFENIVRDTFTRYEDTLADLGVELAENVFDGSYALDIETIKRKAGLAVPPLVSSLTYTTKIRTEAVMRLGYYNMIKVIKKLFKRPIESEKEGQMRALSDGVTRIKQETERSLVFHLGDYRENLKFQYIFKLVDVAATNLLDLLFDRFRIFTTDISEMQELVGKEHTVRADAIDALTVIGDSLTRISGRLDTLRMKIAV